jgi:UDP-glucose 4-epimerase
MIGRITVYGDGKQRPCFAPVHDVVRALHRLCLCDEAVGTAVNVGATEETSVLDLATRVKEMTESSAGITHVPYDTAQEVGFEEMLRRVPDISRVNALAGYEPKQNLDRILEDVISCERARL